MADTPDNSPPQVPKPGPSKEPWQFSADTFGAYIPPKMVPPVGGGSNNPSPQPLPGEPGSAPLSGEPESAPLPGEPVSMPLPGEPSFKPAPIPTPQATAAEPAQPTSTSAASDDKSKEDPDEKEDASVAGVIDTLEAIIIAL